MRDFFSNLGLLWLRAFMGAGIAYHGYQKIFAGWMPKFIEGVGKLGFPRPEIFAWAAALSEFAGGILVVFGLLTRLSALMVFGTMTVAVFMQHGADPLDVKELAVAYWAVAGALVLTGPGRFSLDHKILKG